MKQYSEKELAIFHGVLKLAAQGKNMFTVTAQDIATAAGIGKGTIYGYFSSKEDIIAGAILYSIYQENETAKQKVAQCQTFQEKMHTVYDLVLAGIGHSLSSYHLIISVGGIKDLMHFMKTNPQAFRAALQDSQQMFEQILHCGIQQQVIKPQSSPDYVQMVLWANIMAIGKAGVEQSGQINPAARQTIKENAYTMLVKALN